MVVFDVDFGHTDPQWVLPYGGKVTRRRPGTPDHRPLLSAAASAVAVGAAADRTAQKCSVS